MTQNKEEVIKLLSNIELFNDFSDDEERLESIYYILKEKKVKAGEIIIKEGDVGDCLYIIKKGIVRVLKNTLQNDQYTVIILSAEMKIFFGELALIDNELRSASVKAESDCELFILTRDKFEELARKDPYLGYKTVLKIAKIISNRLRKANKDIITLFEALVHEISSESDISI